MIRLDQEKLETFARNLETRLDTLAPEFLKNARTEIRKTIRVATEDLLQNLDVISREEFDVQAELLRRTRQTLDQLQTRLDEIERRRTR